MEAVAMAKRENWKRMVVKVELENKISPSGHNALVEMKKGEMEQKQRKSQRMYQKLEWPEVQL
ncbi:unnamed protein product [Albugo candida]|uniref:Uncharacterized protein n=1 Tax=Albugo candida TaxID=65357 RepID=A0A024FYP3_9STRA|nr:unnamed protein product [Albugo candida]|eukprot:CCI11794.1 unnamed protein product [Albugo candida]